MPREQLRTRGVPERSAYSLSSYSPNSRHRRDNKGHETSLGVASQLAPRDSTKTRHRRDSYGAMEEVRGLVKALTKADQPEAIADVLRALAKAPVTVPILHELKCGAVVSKLRKHENESVATEAKLLIKQWKGLAAAAGVPQTAKPPPPPQKTHSFAVDDLGAVVAHRGDEARGGAHAGDRHLRPLRRSRRTGRAARAESARGRVAPGPQYIGAHESRRGHTSRGELMKRGRPNRETRTLPTVPLCGTDAQTLPACATAC